MPTEPDSALDRLWNEYSQVFREWDDLTLARWMAQTLGQLEGRVWRLSHPLLGAYRLAAQQAQERQIWLKRLVNIPATYLSAECCRAPLLPLFSRDIVNAGLVCQHCGETCVPFEQLDESLRCTIQSWAKEYAEVHAIAHWNEKKQRHTKNYEETWLKAARQAESMLSEASRTIVPRFLEYYPAVVWEDQDECLEVQPDDIE